MPHTSLLIVIARVQGCSRHLLQIIIGDFFDQSRFYVLVRCRFIHNVDCYLTRVFVGENLKRRGGTSIILDVETSKFHIQF